jgi:hypothetical protein
MPVKNMHERNKKRLSLNHSSEQLDYNLEVAIIIEGRLFEVKQRAYASDAEGYHVELKPLEDVERLGLYAIHPNGACIYLTSGESSVARYVTTLIFSSDRYMCGGRKRMRETKIRKYYKHEIKDHPTLDQATKDRLIAKHRDYYVLFDTDGNHLGLFPRTFYNFSDEYIDEINNTLGNVFDSSRVIKIEKRKFNMEKLLEGVNLC